jgi:hypothetical protein
MLDLPSDVELRLGGGWEGGRVMPPCAPFLLAASWSDQTEKSEARLKRRQ